MSEVCEFVPLQKGNNKINVHEHLMVKEQTNRNKYYWCCEKRKIRRMQRPGNNYIME
jgi:hypothetical protein